VGRAFVQYFQTLYESEEVVEIEECISSVHSWVAPDHNALLTAVFTPDEINSDLAQMHPLKSPGPDGYGVSFFQHQ